MYRETKNHGRSFSANQPEGEEVGGLSERGRKRSERRAKNLVRSYIAGAVVYEFLV